jgi:GNAT superfamily N-acetyltransferase
MGEIAGAGAGELGAPVPIAQAHRVGDFACDRVELDDFLRNRALKTEGKTARTYVVCQGETVVGFYAIAMGSVQRGQAPGKLRRNAPEQLPVAILARMGVDNRLKGHGLGRALIKDALQRILQASTIIGARAVLVHAIDEEVRPFYLKYGFVAYPADSRTLFLPIETLADAM